MKSYSVTEAIKIMGIDRPRCYREMKQGRLHFVKCGKRTLIPEQFIANWRAAYSDKTSSSPEQGLFPKAACAILKELMDECLGDFVATRKPLD